MRSSQLKFFHSWASAFRHPVSQSGIGAFWYRTGSPYTGTGLVPASVFLFITAPGLTGCRTFRHLKKGYTLHNHTASVGGGERYTHAVHVRTAGSEKFKDDLPSTSIDSC
jgi:hypothetical protein